MRRPRFKVRSAEATAYYHCVSRVVGREFLLGAEEKEQFVRFMRLYEKLYGLRVLSFCVMSNHFHLLVEVPQRPVDEELPDDSGLIAHVGSCLGEGAATVLRDELERFREQDNHAAAEDLRRRWFDRMWDVSRYMKVLKQRFTQWYNGRHNRRGTLWEDRFRSVLVEGKGQALKTMTAYIELNPVRAKICEDPKDYRWCGYAEAVAGVKLAREALCWLNAFEVDGQGGVVEVERREDVAQQADVKDGETRRRNAGGVAAFAPVNSATPATPATARREEGSAVDAEEALLRWRCFLFGIPESELAREQELAREKAGGEAFVFRSRISREKALEVMKEGGRLKRSEYLRCRVRYFTDGAVLGSKDFVEGVFQAAKEQFSAARKTGARSLRGIETVPKPERLYNLRQLQKDDVS